MSQIIWIARHGNRLDFVQPEWFNTAQRRYDPPLSDDGIIQAEELAQRLQNETIIHIFASPFLRTIQTAHIVAEKLNLPLKLEAGLGEWHNPEWMTEKPVIHSQNELQSRYPLIDWNYRSQIRPQYPESNTAVNQRTREITNRLTKQFTDNILLIGHGISVMGVAQALVGDAHQIKASLCSLTKIVKEDYQWQLKINGDTSHLSQPQPQLKFN